MNLFGCLKEDADKVMQVLKLDVEDLRGNCRLRTITAKKALVSCYLRHEKGYSLTEIGDYCHKDHSTILYHTKAHANNYALHREKLIQLTQEL